MTCCLLAHIVTVSNMLTYTTLEASHIVTLGTLVRLVNVGHFIVEIERGSVWVIFCTERAL